jgi:BirA family biotin operon repressor/biotin-[acetyl-CoA-carboxylase] ligase
MADRAFLERLARGPASGATLARELGITRAAVWKRVESLRAAGVAVHSTPGGGYALAAPLELLDADRLLAALAPAARAGVAQWQLVFETDSTQRLAHRDGPPSHGAAVVIAERQTAGQGRRGRAWSSPLAAHLYLSVARRFAGGLAALTGLSLAVGIAVAEALRGAGFAQVALKWPNDLVAGGRKLGGILVDVRGEAQGPCEAVIGLGLNVRMPAGWPTGIDQPWCDLAGLAASPPSRHDLAVRVLDALLPALERFDAEGFAAFAPCWPALDALAGHAVRVVEGAREHEGIAVGIDPDGALRVRHADGERRWHGGEVSLRANAAAPQDDALA